MATKSTDRPFRRPALFVLCLGIILSLVLFSLSYSQQVQMEKAVFAQDSATRQAALRHATTDAFQRSAYVLLGSLLASLAAAAYVRSLEIHSRRVGELVAQRTESLRKANQGFVAEIAMRRKVEEELGRSRSELRQLVEHQEGVKEAERKRIAREMHDELGQSLLALRIDLSMMAAGDAVASTPERIGAALLQIDTTMHAMRGIINDLRPAVLDIGLHAAVEWEVAKFARRTGIECHIDFHDDEFPLDDKRATALFRVVQESMTNILRHARASRVDIGIWRSNCWAFMKIADNGVGMPVGCRRKSTSFGLIGIAERVYGLGGAFDTESLPGKGTVITIAIPLAEWDVASASAPAWHARSGDLAHSEPRMAQPGSRSPGPGTAIFG